MSVSLIFAVNEYEHSPKLQQFLSAVLEIENKTDEDIIALAKCIIRSQNGKNNENTTTEQINQTTEIEPHDDTLNCFQKFIKFLRQYILNFTTIESDTEPDIEPDYEQLDNLLSQTINVEDDKLSLYLFTSAIGINSTILEKGQIFLEKFIDEHPENSIRYFLGKKEILFTLMGRNVSRIYVRILGANAIDKLQQECKNDPGRPH